MAKTSQQKMAEKLTREMVYEQCGTMKKYYDADYATQYPLMYAAVVEDHKSVGRYPTDEEITTMIAGTVMVIEDSIGGPLCPQCGGVHKDSRDHPDPQTVAETFPAITKVIDEYNS